MYSSRVVALSGKWKCPYTSCTMSIVCNEKVNCYTFFQILIFHLQELRRFFPEERLLQYRYTTRDCKSQYIILLLFFFLSSVLCCVCDPCPFTFHIGYNVWDWILGNDILSQSFANIRLKHKPSNPYSQNSNIKMLYKMLYQIESFQVWKRDSMINNAVYI